MVVDAQVMRERLQSFTASLGSYLRNSLFVVTAQSGSLVFKAGDRRNILLKTTVSCDGEEEWSRIVSLKSLHSVLRKFGGSISVGVDGDNVVVSDGRVSAFLFGSQYRGDPLVSVEPPHPEVIPTVKLKEVEAEVRVQDLLPILKLIPSSASVMVGGLSCIFYTDDSVYILGSQNPTPPYFVVTPSVFSIFSNDEKCIFRFWEDDEHVVKKLVVEGSDSYLEFIPPLPTPFIAIKSTLQGARETDISSPDQDEILVLLSNLTSFDKDSKLILSRGKGGFLNVNLVSTGLSLSFATNIKTIISKPITVRTSSFINAFTYTGTDNITIKIVEVSGVGYVVVDNGVDAKVYVRTV